MRDLQYSEFSFLRQKAGLSLGQAAELLEVSLDTVDSYERGDGAPRIAELQALKGMRFVQPISDKGLAMNWFKPVDMHEADTSTLKSPRKRSHQAELGQFLTPNSVSEFMAGLFPVPPKHVRLLDAGAGKGALTAAFINRWLNSDGSSRLVAHCYEMDELVLGDLRKTTEEFRHLLCVETEIFEGDFVERAATMLCLSKGPRYTHAILNPPYKKISSASGHRALLSAIGLETVNLYSGFVGLAVALMEQGGEVVAIIPRSFCNGPYYEPFRRFILRRAAIRHIHLFDSRSKAFKGDGVLQENIIIRLTCGLTQAEITISSSTDDNFADYRENVHPFADIVSPGDDAQFIHIPTGESSVLLSSSAFPSQLDELGISVSTGPVVDFRMMDDLCKNPEHNTVPLLYPGHFTRDGLQWPRPNFKKANAIRHTQATAKWLYPCGFYVVVRRFSSKEERRRIVANVVEPSKLRGEMIGFENHLNVFHSGKKPLTEGVARGIAVFLNSTVVDRYFRRFNGHTQVNATDLRSIMYPSQASLIALGAWAKKFPHPPQEAIDARIAEIE